MNKLAFLLAAMLFAGSGSALASGGADLRMEPAPVNRLDAASLQRGARNFVNYCLNCHSAKYMRYAASDGHWRRHGDDPGQPDVRVGQDRRHDECGDDARRRQGVVRHRAAGPVGHIARARQRLALQLFPRFLPRRHERQRLEQPRVPECRHAARRVAALRHGQAGRDRIREPRESDRRRDRPARDWPSWNRARTASGSCSRSSPTPTRRAR